jgi:putative SOS response-associated peptidase YedK
MLRVLRWGLVPSWAKDPSIGNRMINARAETVAEKPSFRAAYRRRRCLVLADGFYEWHQEGSGKTPYFISHIDGSPFAFAGLWEHWQAKESDEILHSATLITTAANEFMTPLHHRMPITLDPARADVWMVGGDETIQSAVQDAPRLRAWAVGREVNNPRNEGVNLIASAGDVLEA